MQSLNSIGGTRRSPLAVGQSGEGEQPVSGFLQAIGDRTTFQPPWACEESCVEGRFQLNPLLSGEPVAEHDGELRFGGGPLTWWHLPLSADLAQHQEQQLGGGLVVGEVAAATHCGA